jgi:hypothetical protein
MNVKQQYEAITDLAAVIETPAVYSIIGDCTCMMLANVSRKWKAYKAKGDEHQ